MPENGLRVQLYFCWDSHFNTELSSYLLSFYLPRSARVRCPECNHEYLLAFSCRGRWFCPSCHAKKVILFGEHLRDEILYPVPHRQFVFSIPIMLRKYFRYDRELYLDFSVLQPVKPQE